MSAVSADTAFWNNVQPLADQGFGPVLRFMVQVRAQTQPHTTAQKPTYGRQPDGSYVAPPSKTDPITNPNGPPPPLIGNGQCVTGTSELSGVTPHTADWTRGKPVMLPNGQVDPSIRKGTAVATFDEKRQLSKKWS